MSSPLSRLLDHFKALADPVRLRLFVLCASAECSVSELRQVTGLSQPRVSQHLKQLTEAGLIERFRDGQFVFYRVGTEGKAAVERRRLLALVPPEQPEFTQDLGKLMALRGQGPVTEGDAGDRALNRALVELTMSAPLGNLLDIGSGEGRVLTLLASRAHRAVGVDTDPDARRHARRELLLAGLPNCTVRQGSMYAMPFGDAEFDTVVVDDVLGDARDPVAALREAARLSRRGGRLVVIGIASDDRRHDVVRDLADWCHGLGLMVGEPRQLTHQLESWFLAVARHAPSRSVAA
jgi:ArsR family transcriptional regulator